MTLQLIFIQCNFISMMCCTPRKQVIQQRVRHSSSVRFLSADHTHTHTHPFNGPLSGTIRVSRYQKGKTSLDFTEARGSEWQWHQLGYMQVCTSLQTDTTPALHRSVFLQAGCPSSRPTSSVKALKADHPEKKTYSTGAELAGAQKSFIAENTTIMWPCNSRQGQDVKVQASKPRPRSKPRSDTHEVKANDKKLVLTPRPRINMRGELWRR